MGCVLRSEKDKNTESFHTLVKAFGFYKINGMERNVTCIEGCLEWGQAKGGVTSISMPVEVNRPRHQPKVNQASEQLQDTIKTISDTCAATPHLMGRDF